MNSQSTSINNMGPIRKWMFDCKLGIWHAIIIIFFFFKKENVIKPPFVTHIKILQSISKPIETFVQCENHFSSAQ